MARMKLELPEHFPFRTELTLRLVDMNHGGHLGNDTMLTLMNEARRLFYERLGYTELDVEGAGTIMSDVLVIYKAEAFARDVLAFEVAAGDFSRAGCDLYYRVTQARTGAEVARAKSAIGFMDYRTRKMLPVPEGFRRQLEG